MYLQKKTENITQWTDVYASVSCSLALISLMFSLWCILSDLFFQWLLTRWDHCYGYQHALLLAKDETKWSLQNKNFENISINVRWRQKRRRNNNLLPSTQQFRFLWAARARYNCLLRAFDKTTTVFGEKHEPVRGPMFVIIWLKKGKITNRYVVFKLNGAAVTFCGLCFIEPNLLS